MAILIVRHGKDEDGYRGGWSQRGLITEGITQCQLLAEHFYNNRDIFKFNRIISSDLTRTKETSEIIAKKFKMDVELRQEWREMNNGKLAGMANDEADKLFPGLYSNTLAMDQKYPDGESPIELFERIKDSFDKLCNEVFTQEEDVLLITHGGVIDIIYYLVNGLEWSNKSKSYKSSTTSIHKVDKVNGKFEMTLSNYTEHLI